MAPAGRKRSRSHSNSMASPGSGGMGGGSAPFSPGKRRKTSIGGEADEPEEAVDSMLCRPMLVFMCLCHSLHRSGADEGGGGGGGDGGGKGADGGAAAGDGGRDEHAATLEACDSFVGTLETVLLSASSTGPYLAYLGLSEAEREDAELVGLLMQGGAI